MRAHSILCPLAGARPRDGPCRRWREKGRRGYEGSAPGRRTDAVSRRDRDHRRPVNAVARLQAERRGQFADRILQYDYDKGRRARGASDKHPDRAAHQVSENAQKEMTESLILTRPRWRRSLRIGGRIGRLYLLINAQIAAQVPPTAFINGLHCQSTPSAHVGRLNVSAPLSKRERVK